MSEQKLEAAKLATALTVALLQSSEFNKYAQSIRSGANKAPELHQVFDSILDHLLGKIAA